MKFKPGYVILYSVFALMGLTFLVFGSISLAKTVDLKFNGIHTKGTIVDSKKNGVTGSSHLHGKIRKNDAFYPVIQYDVKGVTYISSGTTSISNLPVAVGDVVDVVYRASQPEDVDLTDALKESFIGSTVCVVIALIFTSIIAIIGIRVIRIKKEELKKIQD